MARKTQLACPLCGQEQLKVRMCKEVEIVCQKCGASLLITKNEDETIVVRARPSEERLKAVK